MMDEFLQSFDVWAYFQNTGLVMLILQVMTFCQSFSRKAEGKFILLGSGYLLLKPDYFCSLQYRPTHLTDDEMVNKLTSLRLDV